MADPQWKRNERYANDPEYRKRRQASVERYRQKKAQQRRAAIEAIWGPIPTMAELMARMADPTIGAGPPADADDRVARDMSDQPGFRCRSELGEAVADNFVG